MTWKAVIQKEHPWDLGVRLHVYRYHADGRLDVLLPDGILQTVEEAVAPPDNAGLMIPEEALEAIAEAFHPYATGQARLEGEVKALRASLSKEENRVQQIINAALMRLEAR